jgi:hypothetical protein
VQDVAHRAQPNHQQAKVGVRLQALIFSQQKMKTHLSLTAVGMNQAG